MKTMLTPTYEQLTSFVRRNMTLPAHFGSTRSGGHVPHHGSLCRNSLKMRMDFVTLTTLGCFYRAKRKTPSPQKGRRRIPCHDLNSDQLFR
jgi:hypothetical protein